MYGSSLRLVSEKKQKGKMAAKLNKRTIHYREEDGGRAISPLKITRLNPGKPKAVIRLSHHSLTLNADCVSYETPVCVCVRARVCVYMGMSERE